jgi:hypothetical protein
MAGNSLLLPAYLLAAECVPTFAFFFQEAL